MKCHACDGSGQTLDMATQREGRFAVVWASCPRCEGTGAAPASAFDPQAPVTLTIYGQDVDTARVTEVPAWMAGLAVAHWTGQPGVRAISWSVEVDGEYVLGWMTV